MLLDDFSGQKDDIFQNHPHLKRLTIPPRSTSKLQPLDLGVFRHCKAFYKRIYNFVILENINIKLKDRNNICKLWSLIFNQFNSDKFTDLFKNAWSPLEDNQAIDSCNLNQILFDHHDKFCDLCKSVVFIKCSICDKYLCFHDFFIKYHFH